MRILKRIQLINYRKQLHLTQKEVADYVGIHRSYYGLIESGDRNPNLKIAMKISKKMGCSLEKLFPNEIFFANKSYKMKQYM